MLIYRKSKSNSFKLNQLVSQFEQASYGFLSLNIETAYLVYSQQPLSLVTTHNLAQFLTADLTLTASHQVNQLNVWVVPRIGTQSPWSSKATDIMHHCGFKEIGRIEHADFYQFSFKTPMSQSDFIVKIAPHIYDKMTQSIIFDINDAKKLWVEQAPKPLKTVNILEKGMDELVYANQAWGLALSIDEMEYLYQSFVDLNRNPTDVELMMFGQINSEHCRHKIFNANWQIDGKQQAYSLFQMIKNTYQHHSDNILSAYKDNASVIKGFETKRLIVNPKTREYQYNLQTNAILMKVETHNHPTAIAPFEGAATGQGGEIRDEGATGRGGKPKAGLCGFAVSNLNIPGYTHDYEKTSLKGPMRIASPLEIMLKGPIGGAAFNNEFGRPNICGYFRTYEQKITPKNADSLVKGYHKPIMIAGGLGNINQTHVEKKSLEPEALLVVLGGPAMEIGLGGGAASSLNTGASTENLDYASVQRDNPEMQRRVQEVIDTCAAMGNDNPILSIHDIGAGGLCNGLPELVHDSGLGANIELRAVPNAEPSMSPMAIWCCEAQERYVLGIKQNAMELFQQITSRERCPMAVIGVAIQDERLTVTDSYFKNHAVDLPMKVLFGGSPKISKDVKSFKYDFPDINLQNYTLPQLLEGVLQVPSVADKTFLITIGDRTVGGLTTRDQMVGPWQIPVADCGVTLANFNAIEGEAMAMGERTPIAVINPEASARMAVAEAITNIAAARIEKLSDIKLSGNWMAASGEDIEDAALYQAVKAVGLELCPALDLTIPVGKDSLSMRTQWQDEKTKQLQQVSAPVSLIISAFAPVIDVRKSLTPELNTQVSSVLLFIDLANGKSRLGGSAIAQYTNQVGCEAPDVDNPTRLKAFFNNIQSLNQQGKILAYHDRSDGGLWATLCEMGFAANCGLDIDLSAIASNNAQINAALLNEELGAVVQVAISDVDEVISLFNQEKIDCYPIANINHNQIINIYYQQQIVYFKSRAELQSLWSKTSYYMQTLRDNPKCALEAYQNILENNIPELKPSLSFELTPAKNQYSTKPKVAILREQGVNGHIEMAAAFERAGFTPIDVHMSDLIAGHTTLEDFSGLVACGGFSYGDVLGAGLGWAKTILHNQTLLRQFKAFFANPQTFSLGVCNGCQMLSHLKSIIPGADSWPAFKANQSAQFEARLSMVEIQASPSIFFKGMEGSLIPIVVSHGEGRVEFNNLANQKSIEADNLVSLHYTDNNGQKTERYPFNPNGSPHGITALTTLDGRVTIMMPHPERVARCEQFSWYPKAWAGQSPWQKLFDNARDWVG